MKTPLSEIRVGDTVRLVKTVEGEVVAKDGPGIRVKLPGDGNRLQWHDYDAYADIEVTGRRPQVGDVIEGHAAFTALPVGSVARNDKNGEVLVRTEKGWIGRNGDTFFPWVARTLVYLP